MHVRVESKERFVLTCCVVVSPGCLSSSSCLRPSAAFSAAADGSAAAAAAASAGDAVSYSSTMLLPRTDFPQFVKNIYARESSLQPLCRDRVYEWQLAAPRRDDSPTFLLHDGPPFANGRVHTGHFMNKVLKDFINRYKMMRGQRVHYVPVGASSTRRATLRAD